MRGRLFGSLGGVIVSVAVMTMGCNYLEELTPAALKERGRRVGEAEGGTAADGPAPRYYPQEAELGEPLDIEVVRSGNAIILVNRTVHSYEDAELWLNQEYGAPVGRVPIGRGEPIDLESFVNQHAETYPVAQFLAPDADRALVMAGLEMEGRIHKLTVRLTGDWREP